MFCYRHAAHSVTGQNEWGAEDFTSPSTNFIQTHVRTAAPYTPLFPSSTGTWAWGPPPTSYCIDQDRMWRHNRDQVFDYHTQLGFCGPDVIMLDWGAAHWRFTSPSEAPGAL